jgi:hypothetical protein
MKHHPNQPETQLYEEAKVDVEGFPYPITYSSDFKIDTTKHAEILLELWKDFDDNTLDQGAHVFADEVRMDCADGTNVAGTRDEFMNAMKAQRATFSSFVSTINAIVSLKPKNQPGSWACVWGEQTSVSNGQTTTVLINENWFFDQDGKVSYIRQFSALPQKTNQ